MNKKKLHESMMNNIAKSLKSILNEGTYVMTPEDEEYLKQAFMDNENQPTECNFWYTDGQPVVLDSEYGDGNLSIDNLFNDLTVHLSDGSEANLKDVINDRDDIETLHDLIVDYADINESHKTNMLLSLDEEHLPRVTRTPKLPPLTKEHYPHLCKTVNEASQKDKLQHASQFANRVKAIADKIERDCKDYDEKWALGYADQLRNAAEKMLKVLK